MMESLLLGLWVLCLLLPFAIRRRQRPLVVIAVLPVMLSDQVAPPLDGEAWLKRQLEELEKENSS